MFERNKLIDDVINDLLKLNDINQWIDNEKRDDILRELRFISSTLRNIHIEHDILLKGIDAMFSGHSKLAYSIIFSNNKLGTQEEEILDRKFNNQLTNFIGRLVMSRKEMRNE